MRTSIASKLVECHGQLTCSKATICECSERLRLEEEERVRKAAEEAALQELIENQKEREDIRLAEER